MNHQFQQNTRKRKRETITPQIDTKDTVVDANKDEVRLRRLQRFHADNNAVENKQPASKQTILDAHHNAKDNNNAAIKAEPTSLRADNSKIAQQAESRRSNQIETPPVNKQIEPKQAQLVNQTSPHKPQITPEMIAHSIVEKVLKVTTKEVLAETFILTYQNASRDLFYLANLIKDLSGEFGGKEHLLLAEKDVYDALDERLKSLKPGLESLSYLLNCFINASAEQRKVKFVCKCQ